MLAQLLEQAGRRAVLSFPLDPSLQYLMVVEPSEKDVFCISALPPFAFARARILSRQLQMRFPRTETVVGIWGFTGDTELALQRFQPSRPQKLVTSLAEAVKFLVATDPIERELSQENTRLLSVPN
jgi:hypothetical protein